jgi:hypothetical protein
MAGEHMHLIAGLANLQRNDRHCVVVEKASFALWCVR